MPTSKELSDLLQKEYFELHTYARHNIQIYFAWFTFFITTNFVAMGLVAAQISKGQPRMVVLVFVIGLFFCFQSALSVVGNTSVERMFAATSARMEELVTSFIPIDAATSDRPQLQAIVLGTYLRVIKLNRLTLKSMIVCWAAMMVGALFVVVKP